MNELQTPRAREPHARVREAIDRIWADLDARDGRRNGQPYLEQARVSALPTPPRPKSFEYLIEVIRDISHVRRRRSPAQMERQFRVHMMAYGTMGQPTVLEIARRLRISPKTVRSDLYHQERRLADYGSDHIGAVAFMNATGRRLNTRGLARFLLAWEMAPADLLTWFGELFADYEQRQACDRGNDKFPISCSETWAEVGQNLGKI